MCQKTGGSDSVEQIGIILEVLNATSADAITKIKPSSVSVSTTTTIHIYKQVVEGFNFILVPDYVGCGNTPISFTSPDFEYGQMLHSETFFSMKLVFM